MPSPAKLLTPASNLILAALRRDEHERLRHHSEHIHLTKDTVLYHAGDSVSHVYFLTAGMVSLLSTTEDGSTVEVAMVGTEGVIGIPAILRINHTPYQVKVQIPGSAVRVRATIVREVFDGCGQLQDLLLRYTHALLTQVTQSAVCNRFHTVEERLCRWLLVTRDRVDSDTFYLTQESLSHMLGAPRTSITMVAVALQRTGLIAYSRGKITILDREGLSAESCECYRLVKKEIAYFLAA